MLIAIGLLMMLLSVAVHNFDIKDRYDWTTPTIRILVFGGSIVTVVGIITALVR